VTRARGSVKKLAPNNYQIRIGYTENGKRREYKRQNFATKRDADNALANAQVTLGKGRAIDASRQTLGVFLDGWLDIYAKSRGVKPSTLAKTREHLRAYIVPRLGAKSMRELKPQLIARFTSDLLEGGRLNPKQDGSRELSNKTVRNIVGTLSVALAQAVEWGLLPENPCSRIDLPRKTRPELVTLSGEQVAQFLQAAHERRDPMLAIWLLVFTTGMRRGELAGLRWQDIDLVAGTATVTQTRQVLGGEVITGTPKTRAGSHDHARHLDY
jgi:integrase